MIQYSAETLFFPHCCRHSESRGQLDCSRKAISALLQPSGSLRPQTGLGSSPGYRELLPAGGGPGSGPGSGGEAGAGRRVLFRGAPRHGVAAAAEAVRRFSEDPRRFSG